MKRSLGFTLVEIVVTVAILSILAAVMLANIAESGRQSRDIDRRGDLRELQSAIELYKQKNGRYPQGCNGSGAGVWSGQVGTAYECADGSGQYIQGLAPDFIPVLPTDKSLNGNFSGYVYSTSIDNSVYRLIAFQTVEAQPVGSDDPFRICHVGRPGLTCEAVAASGGNTPDHCQGWHALFQTSYAVWGGYYETRTTAIAAEVATEDVICSVPPSS